MPAATPTAATRADLGLDVRAEFIGGAAD